MSEATQFSISRALASTSAASEKAEGRPVSWLISANNRFGCSSRGKPPRDQDQEGDPEQYRVLVEGHKEEDNPCAASGDQDGEKDSDSGALQMIKDGAHFLIGPTESPR